MVSIYEFRYKIFMNLRLSLAAAFLFLMTGCSNIVMKPVPAGPQPIPEVSNILLQLVNAQEKGAIRGENFPSKSLDDLITLGTPAGFRIKLRYEELGVSLVEALKLSRDR